MSTAFTFRDTAFLGERGQTLWTPAQITTALWLKEEGTAASWTDHSGNNRHAAQATPANQPSLANTLNGLTVRTFDGVSDSMTHPVLATDPTALTLAFVFRDESSSSGVIWGHRSEGTRLIQLTSQSSTEIRLQMRSSTSGLIEVSASKSASSWTMVVATFNKSGNSHRLHINGVTGTANTTNFGAGTFNASINTLGATNAGSGAVSNFGGRIAEGIITTAAESQNTIDRLFGYLAHKWDLMASLPGDHPYKTTPPTV